MAQAQPIITITETDESPELGRTALLPVILRFADAAGITIETADISLKGRILATFSEQLGEAHKRPDDMAALSELVKQPAANVVKLPNISAAGSQLPNAVKELQEKGYALPDFPSDDPEIQAKYEALEGSVVNPVLRQGNALRLIPDAVKKQAQQNPHAMEEWSSESDTFVAHMEDNDFYATEKSVTTDKNNKGQAKIVFVGSDGVETEYKADKGTYLRDGDIVDAAVLGRDALNDFLSEALQEAKDNNMLLSLHLKATMMKKTDGVIFGDAVHAFFEPVFTQYGDDLAALDVNVNNGLSDLLEKVETLEEDKRNEIKAAIDTCIGERADLAAGNLDAPNQVIMDVSMANLARWGGKMADADGNQRDTLALIPDSTYARMHQAGIDYLKENGQVDPTKMGTTIAVRLQAGGAQEYGSKDKTFEAPSDGVFKIIAENGDVLHQHEVKKDDIWRMCRTHDDGIQNWVKLGVEQARQTGNPAVFWLDENRAHDAQMIKKVEKYLKDYDTIQIMSPEKAIVYNLERAMKGQDTVAVTGNVIGDHVTDYFPILEIGNSNQMLSLVQLLNGGLVAETGSGGTAPGLITGEKDIPGVANDNRLYWDDLGEAFALAESLRHLGTDKAIVLANALDVATTRYLEEKRSPSLGGLDTRESQLYLAQYWAKAMAEQEADVEMRDHFEPLANELTLKEETILEELRAAQGDKVDLGGRYDLSKSDEIMCSSETLNAALRLG